MNPVRRFFERVRNWTVWSIAGTFGLFLHATIGCGVRSHRLLGIWLLLVWLSASIFTNPESVRPVTAYESYAFSISLLSYLLVPLFIAGITGFLKKQK